MRAEDAGLIALAVLIAIAIVATLLLFYFQLRGLRPFRRPPGSQAAGHGFDSAEIAERVAQVRRDYVGALHSRPHPLFHPEKFIAAATALVRQLGYFQDASAKAKEAEEKLP